MTSDGSGRTLNGPRVVESLEEPLSTSQVISGVGAVLARLETDPEHIKIFRSSRPITDKMTRGPVRIQLQFSSSGVAPVCHCLDKTRLVEAPGSEMNECLNPG